MTTIQIEQMTREEKLQTMEPLWTDLSKVETEIESPSWLETALKETEGKVVAAYANGNQRGSLQCNDLPMNNKIVCVGKSRKII